MSKFLVLNTSKLLLCNHYTRFYATAGPGKGRGKKVFPGKVNEHEPSETIPSTSLKAIKFKSRKDHVLRKTAPLPEESLPSQSQEDASKLVTIKQKSKRKRPKFANTDEKGLPILSPRDCNQRVEFSSKMLSLLDANPELLDKIIFSDEGNFNLTPPTKSEQKASQDVRTMKSFHSPALRRYGESHVVPQIVWCGMTTKYIIGPYFFNSYLTDRSYEKMLRSYLIPQLKALGGGDNKTLEPWWFQQDGNPPHRTHSILKYLGDLFGPRLISYGCPLSWPPRSQDLTPLDYFLWGHLKKKLKDNCYPEDLSTPSSFRRSLIGQIEDVDEKVLKRIVNQFRGRLGQCIEVNGQRFDFHADKDNHNINN